ncbi:MAG: DUF308 domain-containing protein [Clostridia bacterium]|nr:DUF308 domain-containing protein [Clostridia bacterium]
MLKKLKSFKWGYMVITLGLIAVGVCLIAMSNALVALAITIGCLLAVSGIIFGIVTLADKNRGFAFGFKIFFAAIALIGGVVTAIFNEGTVEILVSIFSLLLIVDASFKLNTTVMSKRYSLPLWWVILAISVTVIASGFFMIKYPPENVTTTSILLGIIFIIDAVSNFLSAFFLTEVEKCRKRDFIAESCPATESESDSSTDGEEDSNDESAESQTPDVEQTAEDSASDE